MNKEKFKQNMVKAFNEIISQRCSVCGKKTPKDQLENGDGACYKCWGK